MSVFKNSDRIFLEIRYYQLSFAFAEFVFNYRNLFFRVPAVSAKTTPMQHGDGIVLFFEGSIGNQMPSQTPPDDPKCFSEASGPITFFGKI